jgi:hypothetical protein
VDLNTYVVDDNGTIILDAPVTKLWTEGSRGIIMYTSDGYMNATTSNMAAITSLVSSKPSSADALDDESKTVSPSISAAAPTATYSGSFKVTEKDGSIV